MPQQDLRAGRADGVLVAPLHQRHQHRVEVKALVGEPVLVPAALAAVLIGDLAEQAFLDQAGQTMAEHLPGHGGAALDGGEPAHAGEGLAQHEKRRPLSDDLYRRADRAVGRVVIQNPWPSHNRMLSLVDRLSHTADAGFMNRTQARRAGGQTTPAIPPAPAAPSRPHSTAASRPATAATILL